VIAWINFGVLVAATLLTLYFYVLSAGPAALERRIGPVAYRRCTIHRILSGAAMGLATASYVVYYFFPLPISLPRVFPWPWWLSALIAATLAVPAGYLFLRGVRDAGEETMVVKKEHTLYRGIYEKIRHPQAVGEVPFWWVVAFLLHSPFLVIYSFVWVPVFLVMCLAEERDLVLRYGQSYEEYRRTTGMFIPKRG
jgi:protein-S-isoprenylcysteine O-methyltransferase Ste14